MTMHTRVVVMLFASTVTTLAGCAVFDPLPTPGTRSTKGVQAALCPPPPKDSVAFSGDADAAIGCLDAWRAAYYDALRDHIRFHAGQELLIGALSAKILYDGITDAGNGHQIAALGVGGALLYGNMMRRSPYPKLQVYAAGLQALSCAAIQARPLLMPIAEHAALSRAIEIQSAQLGALSGVLAIQAYSGSTSAAEIDARTALNLMQADLDRAGRLRDRIDHAGAEIRTQVGRIVDNVTEELRATEPDPASITELIKNYRQLAGSFAQGYLPAVVSAPADAKGRSHDGARGGAARASKRAVQPRCASTWNSAGTETENATSAADGPRSVPEALYCAHRGAFALRIRMASVVQVEQVTPAIQGCGNPDDLKPAASIVLQPDLNRIDLKTGGSYTLIVRTTAGIPSVTLYGNNAGALEPLQVDASLGYLVVQIKAGAKPTPSPVQLAITAPNGDTRQVEIVVSKPEVAASVDAWVRTVKTG